MYDILFPCGNFSWSDRTEKTVWGQAVEGRWSKDTNFHFEYSNKFCESLALVMSILIFQLYNYHLPNHHTGYF